MRKTISLILAASLYYPTINEGIAQEAPSASSGNAGEIHGNM